MKHGNITRNQMATLLDLLNGSLGIEAILADRQLLQMKYGSRTLGHQEALENILSTSVVDGLLTDDLEFVTVDGQMIIRQVNRLLFDRNGRRIPRALSAAVCDADYAFFALVQPDLDHYERLSRLAFLEEDYIVDGSVIQAFKSRPAELMAMLRGNDQVANILRGVYLPILIPQTVITDLGETSEKFVEAAAQSYRSKFPDRSFVNYRQGELAKKVKVAKGSRYEQLLGMIAGNYAVALYFPMALRGYSVYAQREQMATLPPGFILSGPIDTGMAWVMYPDVFGQDHRSPVNDCSAVYWRDPLGLLCFRPFVDYAVFTSGPGPNEALSNFSGGLLFVG